MNTLETLFCCKHEIRLKIKKKIAKNEKIELIVKSTRIDFRKRPKNDVTLFLLLNRKL